MTSRDYWRGPYWVDAKNPVCYVAARYAGGAYGQGHGEGRDTEKDAKKMWRAAARFSAVGLELGIAVGIGYAGGWYLDGRFGTKPYLSLVGLLLGIGAGVLTFVRVARELQQFDKDSND